MAPLIAAIASNRLGAPELFHVAGGGLGTGVDSFVLVIGPILARQSISARVELATRIVAKMVPLMPTLVIRSLAAGWQLGRHEGFIVASCSHHRSVVASRAGGR